MQSRKRKLSELYFATVGIPGATEGATAGALYQQKEHQFLEANDLSKYVLSRTLAYIRKHVDLFLRTIFIPMIFTIDVFLNALAVTN